MSRSRSRHQKHRCRWWCHRRLRWPSPRHQSHWPSWWHCISWGSRRRKGGPRDKRTGKRCYHCNPGHTDCPIPGRQSMAGSKSIRTRWAACRHRRCNHRSRISIGRRVSREISTDNMGQVTYGVTFVDLGSSITSLQADERASVLLVGTP